MQGLVVVEVVAVIRIGVDVAVGIRGVVGIGDAIAIAGVVDGGLGLFSVKFLENRSLFALDDLFWLANKLILAFVYASEVALE